MINRHLRVIYTSAILLSSCFILEAKETIDRKIDKGITRTLELLKNSAIDEGKAATIENALTLVGRQIKNAATGTVGKELQAVGVKFLSPEKLAAGLTKSATRDLTTGLLQGVALGIIADSIQQSIRDTFPGDDEDTVRKKELLLFSSDLFVTTVGAGISSKGNPVVFQANLAVGYTQATGKRVETAVITGINAYKALKKANIFEIEGKLWRNVLKTYSKYAVQKNAVKRQDLLKVMLLQYGVYADWMDQIQRKHKEASLVLHLALNTSPTKKKTSRPKASKNNCPSCKNSHKCSTCKGEAGYMDYSVTPTHWQKCPDCYGTGDCIKCP